ncbi:hypothetical protein BC835DRAFT_893160 [Cytidiella melzeri]|nr:hypothetical protein BC835DRAFT_893160 [Cytidiella melzeri]
MFASVFAALLAAPLFAQTASAADCARSYTVKEGDYCDIISAANNASTYQLATVNPSIDANCDNLQPGQVLCLGTEGADCQTTYIVQAGDTCEAVQSNHNINSTILYANNPQINAGCDNIYIGEVLCVEGSFAAPPPGPTIPATVIPVSATPAVTPTSTVISTHTSFAPTPTPSSTDEDDDEDLPECEDDDDDGN